MAFLKVFEQAGGCPDYILSGVEEPASGSTFSQIASLNNVIVTIFEAPSRPQWFDTFNERLKPFGKRLKQCLLHSL